MGIAYNPKWTIIENGLRVSPNYTHALLIQVETSGAEDSPIYRNQRIVIKGTEALNSSAPRSYLLSRLTYSSSLGWQFNSSGSYDVYGTAGAPENLLTYLQTFNTGDILVLNTHDEPDANRTVFRNELVNNFYAGLQYSSVWATRCSYQLIAVKGKGRIYEAIEPRFSNSIITSLWLG
jgi:hypothetical protein